MTPCALTLPAIRIGLWTIVFLLSINLSVHGSSLVGPFMPQTEDFTLLWWANGPQRYHSITAPSPQPVLCLQSGTVGLAIDTKDLRLLHAGKFSKPKNIQEALRRDELALFSLPVVPLVLSVQTQGKHFLCVGRGELPYDDFDFP